MFSFLDMMFNYEDRKADRYEDGEILVDTCLVTDSSKPYETAIAHPKYNSGDIVIVEEYDTEEEAQVGHDKWVKVITGEELPDSLVDVSASLVAELCDTFDNDWRELDENVFIDSWNEDE